MVRMIRLSMGLLAVSLLTLLGLNVTASQETTPPAYFELPAGLVTDSLAAAPTVRFAADTSVRASMVRYTYEPGVEFELEYHGPVLYVVEQGKLGLPDVNGLVLSSTWEEGDPTPGPMPVMEGDEYILLPGHSVFAGDGRLGPTRNAGDEQLVVLALLIVTDPGGFTFGVIGDPNATPMNEIEIGS
jgi:hypothetical protein